MMFGELDFLTIMRKHTLSLTDSEDWGNGEDEAIRSGGENSNANGESEDSLEDSGTEQANSAAVEDTSGGVAFGEATGNSSSAETGLGTLPETGHEETKGQ